MNIDNLAIEYVRLGLTLGQYDPDFVDAYYGPDSLKPLSAPKPDIPKDSLLAATDLLKTKLERIILSPQTDDTISVRARWIMKQLIAFNMRIRIFAGEPVSFEEEVFQLFDVKVPKYNEQYFKDLLTELDKVLPGEGTIRERYKNLSDRFIIPKEKVDTVFKVTINEARRRTKEKLRLPEGETYTLELVTDKPWNGYNWYKGNYISLIQINTDLPIRIDKAIDLVCHEGYPGHHVYNAMLEKNLVHDKEWLEVSFYPLFSPQSFIAEGTADFGIEMAFPESEYRQFAKGIVLPLAGLDTTHFDLYHNSLLLKKQLDYSRNEIARGVLNGTMSDKEILRWELNYRLSTKEEAAQHLRFIKKYRSYVICYDYGQDLVRSYVEVNSGYSKDENTRWQVFNRLLCNLVTPTDLVPD